MMGILSFKPMAYNVVHRDRIEIETCPRHRYDGSPMMIHEIRIVSNGLLGAGSDSSMSDSSLANVDLICLILFAIPCQ